MWLHVSTNYMVILRPLVPVKPNLQIANFVFGQNDSQTLPVLLYILSL